MQKWGRRTLQKMYALAVHTTNLRARVSRVIYVDSIDINNHWDVMTGWAHAQSPCPFSPSREAPPALHQTAFMRFMIIVCALAPSLGAQEHIQVISVNSEHGEIGR